MEKFDAIIVGSGLAGLAAAYTLAGEGLDVLVLERGDYAGAKNVTGGRLYLEPVRPLFPGLWEKAPLERGIVHEEVCLMAPEGSVALRYDEPDGPRTGRYQSYSVLRAKFDRWLAKEAESQGAAIVCRSRVDGPVMEDGRVVGVSVAGESLFADVVVACDGALSLTAERAGIRSPARPDDMAVGFKEVIELDEGVINDRFNLNEGEGTARLFLGDLTRGRFGGGFLYTNRSSISLGLVVGIEDLAQKVPLVAAPDLLDEFKSRREIACLIRGGETVEYAAHVLPEGGYRALGSLYGDGILVAGDAAGFSLNAGLIVRGMDYALASGYYAARAVVQAKGQGDFTGRTLACYETFLRNSFVMKDFIAFQNAPEVLKNPRWFQAYPGLAARILRDLYTVPEEAKEPLFRTLRRHLGWREILSIIMDMKEARKI